MATWVTHLRIAENIIKTLSDIDETAFYIGSLAPDSGRMVNDFTYLPPKDVSHWKRDGVSYEQRFKDNAEFFEKYAKNEADKYKRSYYLGYYVHILTDTMYVRDIIHPYIDKHGKPFWKENITAIRKGWYEIDFRFLEKNKSFYPLSLLKTVKPFKSISLDYFGEDDVYERIKYATELYSSCKTDKECEFFTHTEADAERLISYMSSDIEKILNMSSE